MTKQIMMFIVFCWIDICDAVARLCAPFDNVYWVDLDRGFRCGEQGFFEALGLETPL